MNILHVSPRYVPAVGGAEKHLHELSRRLAAEGHRVDVITTNALDVEYFWRPDKPTLPLGDETIDGVQVTRLAVRHFPLAPRSYRAIRRGLAWLSDLHTPSAVLQGAARLAPLVPELADALRRRSADLDLIGGANIVYEGLLVSARELAARREVPFVLFPFTHLGDSPSEARFGRYYTMRHQRALVAQADAVFLETRLEGQFYRAAGIQARGLIELGSGVNPEETSGGEAARARRQFGLEGRVVLFLGTVSFDKGALTLLAAAERLSAQLDEPVTFVFAGALLDEFCRALEAAPAAVRARVRAPGIVPDSQKNDLLAACDLLAVPSRGESFGIVFLEAWLYGKPVVGARAGGLPDVVGEERDGLLVPFNQPEALADAIRRVLMNPAWAAELGQRGRDKVLHQHTWDRKYAIVREVYRRLAARRPLDDLLWQG